MSQAKNKIEWCLRKAEKELKESGRHRGLVKNKSDYAKAKEYLQKAEHYLKATEYLKKGDFSDIGASTVFYSMYHCLLAIAAKHGYDSRNQECTFALIYYLIEEGKIDLKPEIINKIASLETKNDEDTSVKIRERYQYGTEFTVREDLYIKLVGLAKEVLSKTKTIVED